jgi:hypothetical protein
MPRPTPGRACGPGCGLPGASLSGVAVGPVLLAIGIVLVLLPLFLICGLVFSAILGWLLVDHAEETHAGSELIELNT